MTTVRPHIIDEKACPTVGWDGFGWKTLISGDRTPTAGITQGIAELWPAPFDRRLTHCHAHAETYFVLAGTGVLWIEGETHALAPGVAAFIPGGAKHATFATGDETLRILYTFAADAFSDVAYEFPCINAENPT